MSMTDPFSRKALEVLMQRAEPLLERKLQEYGVSHPRELPPGTAREIFREVVVGSAATMNPDAMVDALDHGLRSMTHPGFFPALKRVKAESSASDDAFGSAAGIDAAVVLAGYGLPVAPLDRKTARLLGEPSNDIDTVLETFGRFKTAHVGYSSVNAPFYILLTDCIRTLRSRLQGHPALEAVRDLFARDEIPSPPDPGRPFQHGMALFRRHEGDKISITALNDPRPDVGSIMLYAGWQDGESTGNAPNGGILPVPVQLLRAIAHNQEIAMWFWGPTQAKAQIH